MVTKRPLRAKRKCVIRRQHTPVRCNGDSSVNGTTLGFLVGCTEAYTMETNRVMHFPNIPILMFRCQSSAKSGIVVSSENDADLNPVKIQKIVHAL